MLALSPGWQTHVITSEDRTERNPRNKESGPACSANFKASGPHFSFTDLLRIADPLVQALISVSTEHQSRLIVGVENISSRTTFAFYESKTEIILYRRSYCDVRSLSTFRNFLTKNPEITAAPRINPEFSYYL